MFDHTSKPMRMSISGENVDDYRMHTCGPRGTSVDGVNSSCGCDPGLQQKEIRYVKTLTIVVLVRVFEQWRRDAFENPMRVTSLKSSCLNVFVGESDDRPGTHFLRALTEARSISQVRPSHVL